MALKLEDRMTTLALLVIGGLTILLGFFSVRHSIKATFYGNLGAASLNLNSSEQAQLSSLHTKDTDTDGLSDYDELYGYNTSPYLRDSDSDGTDDAAEVAAGTDPNCNGATCLQARVGDTAAGSGSDSTSTINSSDTTLGANPTADEIRSLLLNAGVSQEILDQADDATLLDLYQQTLASSGSTPGATTQPLDANYSDLLQNNSLTTTEDLTNLSAEQVRQLLVAAGVDQTTLDQVSDEDLLVIYKQALSDAQTETNTNQ